MVKRNQELNKQVMEMMKKKAQEKPADKAESAAEEQKVPADKPVASKKPLDSDIKEVIKLAATLEKQEEEDMMKRCFVQ